MSLAETTLSSAVLVGDSSIAVASATSLAEGRLIQVDGEFMQVTKAYIVGSTTVPVTRGRDGTAQVAHNVTARVVHGDAADWGTPGAGAVTIGSPSGRPRKTIGYSAAASMALPKAGEDQVVHLDSTAFTLTVPVPTKDLDGSVVTFVGTGGAAYVLVFTGGLSGASTGYTTITFNATGAVAFQVIAMNEVWVALAQIPVASTVTNVTATIS